MKRSLLSFAVLAWFFSMPSLHALDLSSDASYPWATVEIEYDSGDKTVFLPNATLSKVYYARQTWADRKKTCKLQELTKPLPDATRVAAHFVVEKSGVKTETVLLLPIGTKAQAKWIRLDNHLRVRAYASDSLVMS